MPQDVTATLNYYHPESGHEHWPGTVGEKRRKHLPVETIIHDMRGHLADFTLDKQGFQLVNKESVEKDYIDEARIKDAYYKQCADIVKEATGATRVLPYSHVIRKQSFETVREAEKDLPDDARSAGATTVCFVHVDNSYKGAYKRIAGLFPQETGTMSRCRWAIVNLWRPIKHVTRNSLAMSDAGSVNDSELEEGLAHFPKSMGRPLPDAESKTDTVDYYAKQDGQAYGLWQVHPPSRPGQHKWYYAPNMQPDEALLLKIFDSKKSGVARRSAHTSFSSPLDHGSPRESLEVRMFVLWEDQVNE